MVNVPGDNTLFTEFRNFSKHFFMSVYRPISLIEFLKLNLQEEKTEMLLFSVNEICQCYLLSKMYLLMRVMVTLSSIVAVNSSREENVFNR